MIKPDLVAFGGGPETPFLTLAPGNEIKLTKQMGTSFASPYQLNQVVGLRILMGRRARPLSLKALLIHSADRRGQDPRRGGWGESG